MFDNCYNLTVIQQSLQTLKKTYEEVKDKLGVILYFDGGARTTAGYGIHGYVYIDEETKGNSKCPKGYPTNKGYISNKSNTPDIYKVPVLAYINCYGKVIDGTNNMAELKACTVAMDLIKSLPVVQYTLLGDSKYVIDGLLNHYPTWEKNDFKSSTGKPLANKELWQELWAMYKSVVVKHSSIDWVKGHGGDIGNTLADSNATKGIYMGLRYDITDEYVISINTPEDEYNNLYSIHPLLCERRFAYTTYGNDTPVYYQYSMGDYAPSIEKDRRSVLGKRISDTTLSVVILPEKDPVITSLQELSKNSLGFDGIMVGRLDLLNRGSLYDELYKSKYPLLTRKGDNVIDSNGVELLTHLSKPRLAFRLIDDFDYLASVLANYVSRRPDSEFTPVVVTEQVFNISKDKKGNDVYTVNSSNDNPIINCTIDTNDIKTVLPLTPSVDIPDIISLGRLAKHLPKVILLLRKDEINPMVIHYVTVIECNGGFGIWTGAYWNVHVIKGE